MPVENTDTQLTDEQLAQQDGEQVIDSSSEGGDSADQGDGADGYFLNVDERTRYKTRDEAVTGFKNAGTRIAELSAWEKEVGDVYDVHDPRQVSAILAEYIQMKEAAASAAEKESGKGAQETHTVDLSKLSPKEREAFAWLQKVAPDLGYVPKSELKALQDKIASIESGLGNFTATQTAQNVAAGKSQITQLLTSAKLPTDPEFSSFIEDSMAAWIKADAKRISQWQQGGQAANTLLGEAFKYVKASLDRLKVSTAASYQGSRHGGSNKPPITRLPQQGLALRKGGVQAPKKGAAKPTSADLHNAAWALANKRWGGNTDDTGE